MNTIKNFSFLLLISSLFFVSCNKDEEIHPCDDENHISATWNVASYLDVRTNTDGMETQRWEGNSGTMTFNADGSGNLAVTYTSGSNFTDNFTYTTETVENDAFPRKINVNFTNVPTPYTYDIQQCDQDRMLLEAVFTIGSSTYTETIEVVRM